MIRVLIPFVLLATVAAAQQPPRPQPHGRLFPPQDLGLLEAPDRDLWQHPDRVMDTLKIAERSVVADIGAGSGWFTIRLARRVGPNGLVYSQDVQQEMLAAINRRVQREGLLNVKTIKGEETNPLLPPSTCDAILLVDTFHESEQKYRVPFLKELARALKPGGRIGIIDFKLEGSGPGPPNEQRLSPDIVISDAASAGLRFSFQETYLPYQYFLIFERQATDRAIRGQATPTRPEARRPPRTP
jgi:ubiquinone/menaquinone biosynthesis C-methylase UbiE